MNRRKLGRILIAASKSGSGKTLITCGLLSYLKNKGESVKCYKCGPDYIDPMFHRQVLGLSGGNLDSYFADNKALNSILASTDEELAVIEGVMGIYDGIGGIDIKGSCYDVARATATPIILVVDAYGCGRTIISLVKGIIADDSEGLIKGIILNRISKSFYETISVTLQEELDKMSGDIRLLGCVEKVPDIRIESRHLGLKQPWEIDDINNQIHRMEEILAESLDMCTLMKIMSDAPDVEYEHTAIETVDRGLTLAVARDEAFCFYYEENLQMLARQGIRIKEFSPIHDECLPQGIHGILLGGGYPELFLKELSENESMKNSIYSAIKSGMPSLAECGGFMYLHSSIYDENGIAYSMAGVINGECRKRDRLVRFGYIQLADNGWLGSVKGHEFHYYDSNRNGEDALAVKPTGGKSWKCMHIGENYVWGFPHLYYPSADEFIYEFIIKMQEFAFMS